MILVNRTNKHVFWQINCLPPRKHRGRLMPAPKISLSPFTKMDLSVSFSEEDLKLIRENEKLPKHLGWLDEIQGGKSAKVKDAPLKDPLTPGTRSVLDRMSGEESQSTAQQYVSDEEITSQEVEEMQDALGSVITDIEPPEDDGVMPEVNVSAEEPPTPEELEEIQGRRPAQSWRRRQLWCWAYNNGLQPEDFSNKRSIWDLIKNHLDG